MGHSSAGAAEGGEQSFGGGGVGREWGEGGGERVSQIRASAHAPLSHASFSVSKLVSMLLGGLKEWDKKVSLSHMMPT